MSEHEMNFQGIEKADKYLNGAVRDNSTGKGAFELISPIAIERIAIVYEKGAKQKGERNWENGIPLGRFMQSAMRHMNQYLEGKRDEDHLAMAAWNIIGLIHTEEMIRRGVLPSSLNNLPSYIPTVKKE